MADSNDGHRPSYLALLEAVKLERRVEALERLLQSCAVCPLDCGNDRTRDELVRCYSGRLPVVPSYIAHFGEEPAPTGTRGAGNVFFSNYSGGRAVDGLGVSRCEHPMTGYIVGLSISDSMPATVAEAVPA